MGFTAVFNRTGSVLASLPMNSNDAIFEEFKELYRAKELPDWQKVFIKDGVIHPAAFAGQRHRVLFIAKEHNYLGGKEDTNYKADYREWWKEHIHLLFSHRISEWAYGLLNDFSTGLETLSYAEKHSALQSIAFINVKKSSGGATANKQTILAYISESRELLHRQIQGIAPTLIISCFRHDYYTEHLFANNMKRVSAAYSLGSWNGIPVITYYHPSSRKNKKQLYTDLARAFEQIQSEC